MILQHRHKRSDLVAVDDSQASQRAVSYAVSKAHRDEWPLVFVHVFETADHRDERDANPPSINAALQSAANGGVSADALILHGKPRQEIIAAALDMDPRFIFVGTSGLTGLDRWLLGSVAADVVRHSDTPVIVVPPVAYPPTEGEPLFSRMLVPIDPEAKETSPVSSAIALAAGTQRHIVFCAVVDEDHLLRVAAQVDGGWALGGLIADARSGAQRTIDAAVARARANEVTAEGFVGSGEPVDTICKLADQKSATAIVMGTHGRQGVSRIFLGSTTQGVLAASRVPVVTFRLGHGLLEVAQPIGVVRRER